MAVALLDVPETHLDLEAAQPEFIKNASVLLLRRLLGESHCRQAGQVNRASMAAENLLEGELPDFSVFNQVKMSIFGCFRLGF